MNPTCPLCRNSDTEDYHHDQRRSYLYCNHCHLVFVPEQFHLTEEDEKKEYDFHENNPEDLGYRRFLSRLCTPLLEKLDGRKHGLDFGCGPGPALAIMLEEQGHQMSLYDIFYQDDRDVFLSSYDFVCTTEVVEHLRNPAEEIDRLIGILRTGGWLAIMTKLVINREAFSNWHYIQDMTHICFYSRETFQYLSERYDCELHFVDKDVVFLQKTK